MLLGLALCFGPLTALHAADGFVPGFEDIPLAPGLTAVPDAAMSFDSAGEHLARTGSAGTYRREGEELVIEIARSGDALTVRFALAPR